MAEQIINGGLYSLKTTINATATVVTLTAALPSGTATGNWRIIIDSEIMLVTNLDGTRKILTVTRAQEGTSGVTHTAGTAVQVGAGTAAGMMAWLNDQVDPLILTIATTSTMPAAATGPAFVITTDIIEQPTILWRNTGTGWAIVSSVDALDARLFGVKGDGALYGASGGISTTTGIASSTAHNFDGVKNGMMAVVEGGGTPITRTGAADTSMAQDQPQKWITMGVGQPVPLDYVGATVVVSGQGNSAGTTDLVTQIQAIRDDGMVVSLRSIPLHATTGPTATTLTIYPPHVTTISAVAANGSTVTLATPPPSAPLTFTDLTVSGPGLLIGTDNGAANTALMVAASALIKTGPSRLIGTVRHIHGTIEMPPGMILMSDTNLIPISTNRFIGYNIKGHGNGVTQIVYIPRANNANNALMYDTSQYHGTSSGGVVNRIMMRDMMIFGYSTPSNLPNFFELQSAGAEQGHAYEDIEWTGSWNNIFYGHGTDTGDKHSWTNCRLTAKQFANFYYIPPEGVDTTVGGGAGTAAGSANQMHYEWVGGMRETIFCTAIWNMGAGGNIHDSGSFICTGKGTLYKMSGTSRLGARSIHSKNQKCELRTSDTLLLDTTCDGGEFIFDNVMIAEPVSIASGTGANLTTDELIKITIPASSPGPYVEFRGGTFKGRLGVYWSGVSAWQYRKQIIFKGAAFTDWNHPEDYVVFHQTDATGNTAGIPRVYFDQHCREIATGAVGATAGHQYENVWGCVLNQNRTPGPVYHFRERFGGAVSTAGQFSTQLTQLPAAGGTQTKVLPVGSRILSITLIVQPGATLAATAQGIAYTVTDGNGTVLATFRFDGDSPTNGLYKEVRMFPESTLAGPYDCDTDLKRQLTLTGGASLTLGYAGTCELEYI